MQLRVQNGQDGGRTNAVLRLLRHSIGLDRAIAFTVFGRFWSAASGLLTVLLIARLLTPTEQGYYYTFYSLVSLTIVFELGFTFVILQMAAHERAHLQLDVRGLIEGDEVAIQRLASILQLSVRWYSRAALAMCASLIIFGTYFFAAHQPQAAAVAWRAPWVLLVVVVAFTFQMDPVYSFLEGCGFVTNVAKLRIAQAIAGTVLAWAALLSHAGLYAPAMMVLGQGIAGAAFLFHWRKLLAHLYTHQASEHRVDWRSEIWPFQWRIAVSWACGYFIFQIFNPVLFAFRGPVAAGTMGMSLNIATSMSAVALAWVSTKASPFGAMVARGERDQLDRVFFRTLWQSSAMLVALAAGFLLCLVAAATYLPRLAGRVLPPGVFAVLLLAAVMNHLVFAEAMYMRAHKREPLMVQSILVAAGVAISTVLLAKFYGPNEVTFGYCAVAFLGLVFATRIFVRKRREWESHSPSPASATVQVAE